MLHAAPPVFLIGAHMEEVLFGRIRMTIPDAQFRVSTDSMVLADFCRDAGGRGLDLGCGCGTLGRPEVSAASRSSRRRRGRRRKTRGGTVLQTGFRSSAEIFGRRTRRSRPGALILPSPIRRIIRRAAGGCGRKTAFRSRAASSAARSTRCAPQRRGRCAGAGGCIWSTSRSGWPI